MSHIVTSKVSLRESCGNKGMPTRAMWQPIDVYKINGIGMIKASLNEHTVSTIKNNMSADKTHVISDLSASVG